MTDTPSPEPSANPGTSGESGGLTVEKVREVVSDVLDSLFRSGEADVTEEPARPKRRRTAAAEEPDIDAQVQRAVAAAKEKDAKDAKEAAQLKRIDELEAKVKSTEQPPAEFRKITKFLWGDRS